MSKRIWLAGLGLALLLVFGEALEGRIGEDCFRISALDKDAERVTVTNTCNTAQHIGNWAILSTSGGQVFRFPAFCLVAPQGTITIHSGAASQHLENLNDLCWYFPGGKVDIELYWDTTGPDAIVWNSNKTDNACLLNRTRQLIDATGPDCQ